MPRLSSVDRILTEHVQAKSETGRLRLFSRLSRKEVAAQIRQLREKRGLTQMRFAKLCKMKQSAVSRIEQADYSGWNYKTLARIADKLRARLRITFEPLEEVIAKMETEEDATFASEDVPRREAAHTAPVQPTVLATEQDRGGLSSGFADYVSPAEWPHRFELVQRKQQQELVGAPIQ
jgi:transcriptional regulator with XRE-family HTH domain